MSIFQSPFTTERPHFGVNSLSGRLAWRQGTRVPKVPVPAPAMNSFPAARVPERDGRPAFSERCNQPTSTIWPLNRSTWPRTGKAPQPPVWHGDFPPVRKYFDRLSTNNGAEACCSWHQRLLPSQRKFIQFPANPTFTPTSPPLPLSFSCSYNASLCQVKCYSHLLGNLFSFPTLFNTFATSSNT